MDWDNLAVGYKAFQDGLQEVVRRDLRYGDILGAGLIEDDKQIVDARIRVRIGDERSEIVIRRAA